MGQLTIIFLIACLVVYILALLYILLYSLSQAYLTFSYVKHSKKNTLIKAEENSELDLPLVTVQLPVYNELYVVERLIDAVAKLNYPADKLEIQVLDDSDDETVEITQKKVSEWKQKGIDIQQVRRGERTGFKAGALREGMKTAKGDFLAIFDADFIPDKYFLKQAIAAFTTPEIGMVQTRWGHLNKNASILTKAQAFTIDAHFRIEQTGRNSTGCFINFNGTAGVWRKECIADAGNWQDDTLTEDLDLSYRAQLKGWRFVYLEHVISPAELPPVMSAIKSQQYRWNKGGAETAKKLWWQLIKAPLPLRVKWQGTFHLFNSAVFVAVFLSAIFSIPTLYLKQMFPAYRNHYDWLILFLISFAIVAWIYYIISKQYYNNRKLLWKNYIREFPLFLSVSMGLSLHNAIAVIEGYIGRKTPFIRTPKFNTEISDNRYVRARVSPLSVIELLLTGYFIYGIYYGIATLDFTMLPFHTMLAIGFGIVSYHSIFNITPKKINGNK